MEAEHQKVLADPDADDAARFATYYGLEPRPASTAPDMIREVREQLLDIILEPDLAPVLKTTRRKLQEDRLKGNPVGPWVRGPGNSVFYFISLLAAELLRRAEGRSDPLADVRHRASPKRRRGVTA